MELLEKLERKVNLILESNKNLRSEIENLKKENLELKSSGETLENSLLQESNSNGDLQKEKDAIKIVIEALLQNIDKLEEIKS